MHQRKFPYLLVGFRLLRLMIEIQLDRAFHIFAEFPTLILNKVIQ